VIIPLAGLLALLSPALAGGRLSRYAEIRLRTTTPTLMKRSQRRCAIQVPPLAVVIVNGS